MMKFTTEETKLLRQYKGAFDAYDKKMASEYCFKTPDLSVVLPYLQVTSSENKKKVGAMESLVSKGLFVQINRWHYVATLKGSQYFESIWK